MPINIFDNDPLMAETTSAKTKTLNYSMTSRGLKPNLKLVAYKNITPVTVNKQISQVTNKIYSRIPSKYNDNNLPSNVIK